MQKWCPEPLVDEGCRANVFETLTPVSASADGAVDFRPEAGFGDSRQLLRQLPATQRAQITELVEQELRREYEERHRRDREAREAAEAERRREETEQRERWQRELAVGLHRELLDALGNVARETAAMAVLMASKLVRREVAQDPEVLVRAIETVLYKSAAGCPLSVTVHPEDAAWLGAAPALCERLRIQEIKEDRRLERGGCLVKTDELEWDATVERQLSVLGEALDEALSVPPAAAGEDDGPRPPEVPDA
jgi:flagellar assembly protein FliH